MGRPRTLPASLPGLGRAVRRFWPYIRRELPLIGGSLLALLAEVALRLLEPWPLKLVFDRIFAGERVRTASGIPALDALDPMILLLISALALVAIVGLRALAAYYNTIGFALIGNRVLTQVRHDLFSHLQCLSLSFHNKARSGDLIVRVIGDVGMLKEVTVTAMLPLLGNLLVLAGMVGLMFWLNRELTLLALAIVPLFWFSSLRLGRRIQEVARKQRKQESAMAATAAEAIGAIKTVQALSIDGTFAKVFASENKKNLTDGVKAKRLEASLERRVDVLVAISTALTLSYGAWLVLHDVLTPGDLLVFLSYLKSGLKPLKDLAKYTGRLAKAAAAGERVLDLLERRPDVRDLPGARRAPAFRGALRFEGVSFAYEPGWPVLKGIDFAVPPGHFVAIVGPSGSGKSTLASLILRLYDPAQGRITIDGYDIREFTLASLRARISVVMQDSLLFAASVRENIAYGVDWGKGHDDAYAQDVACRAAASLANAEEFIAGLPEGYDTVLGERGVTLSNGQRQRIALARAALRRSPILVLDEPTTGLDEENQRAVVESLDRLARDRTTFLITHDLKLASSADLILYLQAGRLVERGRHKELLEANARYAAMYRLQTAPDRPAGLEAAHALRA